MVNKICNYCHIEKEIKFFPPSKAGKFGVKAICRECANSNSRKYYREHPEKFSLYWKKYSSKKRDELNEIARDYWKKKQELKKKKKITYLLKKDNAIFIKNIWLDCLKEHNYMTCRICGFNEDFCAIDLHHINGNKDKIRSSRLFMRKLTQERLDYILKETVPLCANCHRMIHYSDKYKDYVLKAQMI